MNSSVTIGKPKKSVKDAIYWIFNGLGITITVYKSDKIQNLKQAHSEAMRRLRRYQQ